MIHNSKNYDNRFMIDIFSKIPNIQINCLAQNQERFKMLSFKIPNKKWGVQPHFCPWKNVCFPIFPHGEKWEKKYMEREGKVFICFSLHILFSP